MTLCWNTSRQRRFIKQLAKFGSRFRFELTNEIGALNVPQIKFELLRLGWDIKCKMVETEDRDGQKVRVGYYYISDEHRLIAQKLYADYLANPDKYI